MHMCIICVSNIYMRMRMNGRGRANRASNWVRMLSKGNSIPKRKCSAGQVSVRKRKI